MTMTFCFVVCCFLVMMIPSDVASEAIAVATVETMVEAKFAHAVTLWARFDEDLFGVMARLQSVH